MAVASEVKGERSRLSLLAVVLRFMRLCAMATASMQDLQPPHTQHSLNEHRQQQPPTLWRRSAALRHGRPASERVRGP